VANSLTSRRWFPTQQPQTLQIACALLYWNAFLSLLDSFFGGGVSKLYLLLMLLELGGAFGISNARKVGYNVAVAAAVLPLMILVVTGLGPGAVLPLLFDIALLFLLLHPMTRQFIKVWFR
jgi:hypothetical protein